MASIHDRIARQLDRDSDELAGVAPANLTPVHIATVDVLGSFLDIGEKLSATGTAPAQVRALMTFLRRCRPLLLEQLGDVEPEMLREFVREIRDQLSIIVDTRLAGEGVDDDRNGAPGPVAVIRPA